MRSKDVRYSLGMARKTAKRHLKSSKTYKKGIKKLNNLLNRCLPILGPVFGFKLRSKMGPEIPTIIDGRHFFRSSNPRRSKMASNGLRWLKMAQDGPKLSQILLMPPILGPFWGPNPVLKFAKIYLKIGCVFCFCFLQVLELFRCLFLRGTTASSTLPTAKQGRVEWGRGGQGQGNRGSQNTAPTLIVARPFFVLRQPSMPGNPR